MELSLLAEDRLRVLLSPLDMEKYHLTCAALDYGNTETRRAMWSILDDAKHETGFDAAAGKICIKAYPERDGGCVLYINKLMGKGLPPAQEMNSIGEKLPAPPQAEVRAVYRFESTENLARACRLLAMRGYEAPSDAFWEELPRAACRYYLLIRESAAGGKKTRYLRENLALGEFGKRLDGDISVSYLGEHCKRLCERDAVHVLAPLAK